MSRSWRVGCQLASKRPRWDEQVEPSVTSTPMHPVRHRREAQEWVGHTITKETSEARTALLSFVVVHGVRDYMVDCPQVRREQPRLLYEDISST